MIMALDVVSLVSGSQSSVGLSFVLNMSISSFYFTFIFVFHLLPTSFCLLIFSSVNVALVLKIHLYLLQ
jgi:hypothetical protein